MQTVFLRVMPTHFHGKGPLQRLTNIGRPPVVRGTPLVDSATTPKRTIRKIRGMANKSLDSKGPRNSRQISTSTTGLLSGDSEDDSFMAPDDEMIRRATKSRSKTQSQQSKNIMAELSQAKSVPQKSNSTTKASKDLDTMNELGRLLNAQTKELMEKIDSNQSKLTENQDMLSQRIVNLELLNEQRSNEIELRLNKLEGTIISYETSDAKLSSMAEMIDKRMKEINDANKRYEVMFRDVAKEIAVLKASPNQALSQQIDQLKAHVDQVDQNSRNIFLILTGLAPEFQNVAGVVQFIQNYLKVGIQPTEIASVASIGQTKLGQTLTKVTFFSVDSRVRVYKARASMRGTANQIWLNEDLTKNREWLDYLARLLFKGKYITNNWTFLGDIYIKKTVTSLSQKIIREEDFGPLPPDLQIQPRGAQIKE